MSKNGKFVSAEENVGIVNEMLKGNEVIEKALAKWKDNQLDICDIASVYKSIVDRDREYGGLIVSVECGDIPAGSENVQFYNGGKKINLNKTKDSDDNYYFLVFTSREKFQKFNETAGAVMFIQYVFSLLTNIEGVEGIVMNMGSEEVILNKKVMKMIDRMIEIGECNQ